MRRLLLLWAFTGSAIGAVAQAAGGGTATSRYELGYEIYLDKGNIAAAYQLAEQAVRERPGDLTWRRRLAKVALWLDRPQVALQNWLVVAKASDDEAAWQEVGTLAQQLNDDEALVVFRRREAEKHPDDTQRLSLLVSAYERVGRPEEGMAFLDRLRQHHPSRALDDAGALLAEHSGHDDLALARLQAMVKQYGPEEGLLLRIAGLYSQRGELGTAQKILLAAAPQMPEDAVGFWKALAELARLLGNDDTALAAYNRVYASGHYTEEDLVNHAALLVTRDRLAAARLQALLFERFGRIDGASAALDLWLRENSLAAADAFLRGLSAEQLARLETDPGFHEFRGHLRLAQGDWQAALNDYAAGLKLAPTRRSLQESWLTLMIERGDPAVLRKRLIEGAATAQATPSFWHLWAAGWSRLDSPVQALPYLKAINTRTPDNALEALAYADALNQAGLPDPARALEKKIWRSRSQALSRLPTAPTRQELSRALLNLELQHLPADNQQRRMLALVHDNRDANGQTPAWVRDLILGHIDASEPTRPLPRGDVLPMALASNDMPALDAFLATRLREAPAPDQIEAAERLGRRDLAASLAFEAAELHPDDDELHHRLQERAWQDANGVNFSYQYERQGELTRQPAALIWQQHLSGDWLSRLQAENALLESRARVLRLPIDRQHWAAFGIGWQGQRQDWRLDATVLNSLKTVPGAALLGHWQDGHSLRTEFRAGWQQRTTVSSGLRVGGMRDLAGMNVDWGFSSRDSLLLELEYSHIKTQDGAPVGDIGEGNLNYAHALSAGGGGWLLKAGVGGMDTGHKARVPTELLPLVPVGDIPDIRDFVPKSFTQFSLALGFGEDIEQSFQRNWRPYGEAELTWDTTTKFGYVFRAGMLGPVFGRDRLRFAAEGANGGQTNREVTRIIGMDYWIYY